MSAKIFLDTNVLVYLYTATEPIKREIAVALAQDGEVWISTQVLQYPAEEIFIALVRYSIRIG